MGKAIPFEPGAAEVIRDSHAYHPVNAEEVHTGVFVDKDSRSPFVEVSPLPRRKAVADVARTAMEGFITPPERSDK